MDVEASCHSPDRTSDESQVGEQNENNTLNFLINSHYLNDGDVSS
jgi:hypothetical protein